MNIKINNRIKHPSVIDVLKHVLSAVKKSKDIDDMWHSHGVFESRYPFKKPICITSKRTKNTLTINIEEHRPLI